MTSYKTKKLEQKTKSYLIGAGIVAFVALLAPKYGLVFGALDLFDKN